MLPGTIAQHVQISFHLEPATQSRWSLLGGAATRCMAFTSLEVQQEDCRVHHIEAQSTQGHLAGGRLQALQLSGSGGGASWRPPASAAEGAPVLAIPSTALMEPWRLH